MDCQFVTLLETLFDFDTVIIENLFTDEILKISGEAFIMTFLEKVGL